MKHQRLFKLFLRLAISTAFLSAVADRLGFWPKEASSWGNWNSFLEYTSYINPWLTDSLVSVVGMIATIAEIVFACCLIIGFKTALFARLSGYLLLIFALAITLSSGVKGAFDYSVFVASGAAFSLSLLKDDFLEIDTLLKKKTTQPNIH